MKYFIDTEFVEKPGSIELISIGIVSETGASFYAESCCFDERNAPGWVQNNVLPHLKWIGKTLKDEIIYNDALCHNFQYYDSSTRYEVFGSLKHIRDSVRDFIKIKTHNKLEFWGYYADYDWVLFCWLFGTMMDLPKGYPMYCKDIKQVMDEKGNPQKPENKSISHNALDDAKYHKELYDWIINYEKPSMFKGKQ